MKQSNYATRPHRLIAIRRKRWATHKHNQKSCQKTLKLFVLKCNYLLKLPYRVVCGSMNVLHYLYPLDVDVSWFQKNDVTASDHCETRWLCMQNVYVPNMTITQFICGMDKFLKPHVTNPMFTMKKYVNIFIERLYFVKNNCDISIVTKRNYFRQITCECLTASPGESCDR